MNDKLFCGSGKKVEFGNGGSIMKMSICLDDLEAALAQGYGFTSGRSGKRYVRVEAKRKRDPDERGNTHYLEVDTWKPNQSNPRTAPPKESPFANYSGPQREDKFEDDIPF